MFDQTILYNNVISELKLIKREEFIKKNATNMFGEKDIEISVKFKNPKYEIHHLVFTRDDNGGTFLSFLYQIKYGKEYYYRTICEWDYNNYDKNIKFIDQYNE